MEEDKATQTTNFGTHMKTAGQEFVHQWKSLLPDNFWTHRREVRRQMLLATRSLIESAIEKLDPDGEDEKTSASRRKTKIKVEKKDD